MTGNLEISPDFIEPLIGYRGWVKQGIELYSLYYYDTAWTNEVTTAYCQCCKGAPGPFCADFKHFCGIHAFKYQDDLFSYLRRIHYDLSYIWSPRNPQQDVCLVVGKVLLWGTIVEHKMGYRAQYAKISGTPMHFLP